MTSLNSFKIVLIGGGQLGSRYLQGLAKTIHQASPKANGNKLAIIQALGVSESLQHMAGKGSMVDQEIAIHLTDVERALKSQGISIQTTKSKDLSFVSFDDTNELFHILFIFSNSFFVLIL